MCMKCVLNDPNPDKVHIMRFTDMLKGAIEINRSTILMNKKTNWSIAKKAEKMMSRKTISSRHYKHSNDILVLKIRQITQ